MVVCVCDSLGNSLSVVLLLLCPHVVLRPWAAWCHGRLCVCGPVSLSGSIKGWSALCVNHVSEVCAVWGIGIVAGLLQLWGWHKWRWWQLQQQRQCPLICDRGLCLVARL